MWNNQYLRVVLQVLIGVLGTFITALGAVYFICANNGMDPVSVFAQGLSNKTGLQLGTWSLISGVVVLIIVYFLDRRMLKWGSFINAFGVGFFINVIMSVYIPSFSSSLGSALGTMVGAFLLAFGLAVVIFAEIGMGPWEGLMTYMSNKTNISIKFIRIFMDFTLTLVGFILGGKVGFGSIIGVFGVGPIIEYSLRGLNFIFRKDLKVAK